MFDHIYIYSTESLHRKLVSRCVPGFHGHWHTQANNAHGGTLSMLE